MKIHTGRFDETEDEGNIKLDIKDKKILSLLSEDSRIPFSIVAKKVQLSRDGIQYRYERMKKLDIIKRGIPIVNLRKFGFHTFHVFMLLEEMEKEKQKELLREMIFHPNTKAIREFSDSWDIELVFIAETLKEMDKILTEITQNHARIISQKMKLQVIKGYNSMHLPYDVYGSIEKSFTWKDAKPKRKYIPDDKDRKLITKLALDCRVSTYELGKLLKLSPDAISYRLKLLKESGIIRKYGLIVDLTKLHYHWFTFVMQVRTFTKDHEKRMEQFVRSHNMILRSVKTLGNWDFMIDIVTQTRQQYHSTIKEIKSTFSDIIKNYETWVAYREYYFDVFPVAAQKISGETTP